jgi:hypothetical protein
MRRLPTGVLLFRVKVLSPRANLSPGGLAGARYCAPGMGIDLEVEVLS